MSRSSTDDAAGSAGHTSPEAPHRLLEVGRIVRPHGLGGEVIVALTTNRTERLDPGQSLVARLASGEDGVLTVVSSTVHQRRFIVRFSGIDGREAAESLRDTVLLAEPIVDDEALFVHELIGCELVETSGTSRGRIVSVQENPASDLLVGEAGWLVPLRFVVSREPGRVVVDVPAGLFE